MKTDNLVKELQKYNIRAANYVHAPFGDMVFALTVKRHKQVPEGTILVHQGNATIHIHNGSKKFKQATVSVREQSREVTKDVTASFYHPKKPDLLRAESELRKRFPVFMPRSTQWTAVNVKIGKPKIARDHDLKKDGPPWKHWPITGTVTGKVVNNTTNHFLMGVDEKANFICALPRAAKTVAEAHRLLRPRAVQGKVRRSPRQGEWFFVPIDRSEQNTLNKLATAHPGRIRKIRLGHGHVAKSATYMNRNIYARGYIVDTRTGHHEALCLPTWRKVVKNREATVNISREQAEMAGRRARTWD